MARHPHIDVALAASTAAPRAPGNSSPPAAHAARAPANMLREQMDGAARKPSVPGITPEGGAENAA